MWNTKHSQNVNLRTAHFEASAGRAAAPEWDRSMGIGNTSQQAFFARKPDRDFDAKKQGVYHLALLASIILQTVCLLKLA